MERISQSSTGAEPAHVRALLGGRARGNAHMGVLLVSPTTWTVHGKRYYSRPHVCSGGCATASALRVLGPLLDLLARGHTARLLTTNTLISDLIARWQGGDTTLPAWYTPHTTPGALHEIANRIRDLDAGKLTVVVTSTQHPLTTFCDRALSATFDALNSRNTPSRIERVKADLAAAIGALTRELPD